MKLSNSLLLTFLVVFGGKSLAQSQYIFESQNIQATLNEAGDIFYDPVNQFPGFEIPKNSDLFTIYQGQLWIGGIDSATSQLIVSAQTYRQFINTWYPGTIANTYTGISDGVHHATKAEVDDHLANYISPAYSPPQNFLEWPAEGLIANGEPRYMAPFVDINNDGVYNPFNGDHPFVTGNSSAYIIFNDSRDSIGQQGNPCCMGVDVQAYYYDLSATDPSLSNTIFANYKIVNRSSRTYRDVYIGLWLDADIGNWLDDFIGCSPSDNLFFSYNADPNDEGSSGYGNSPPAQGLVFLNSSLASFVSHENSADSLDGFPFLDKDFYNYMSGNWKNGSSITLGADGKVPGNPPTNYLYSGSGWTEEGLGNSGGDRRMVGSVGPYNLGPGDTICLDWAMIYFRNLLGNNLTNRDSLIFLSRQVQNFYDQNSLGCNFPTISAFTELTSFNPNIFPNPSDGLLNINYKGIFDIKVFNSMGQEIIGIEGISSQIELDMHEVPPGVYSIQISSSGRDLMKKVLIY